MINKVARCFSLVTIVSIMIAAILGSLLIAAGTALYSSYKFDLSLAERSQFIISSSLQNGALPFALATEDTDLIRSIVESQVQYEEVYAIEIRGNDSNIVYRSEKKEHLSSLKITPKTVDIISPYESVSLDGIDDSANQMSTLGTLTIYFSSDSLEAAITRQAFFAGSILFVAIVVIATLLHFFRRLISKYLQKTLKTMEIIKKGEAPDWNAKYAPSLKEMRVMYDSLRHLSLAIFERDSKLKESLQEALDAKLTAEQAEHFKDDFIRAICHDIRTPVGVVLNLLALIQKDTEKYTLDQSLLDKLNACHQSARVLNDVTSELFDFDQFQSMELIESKERVSIPDLFDRIGALYSEKFSAKNINFSISRNDFHKPCKATHAVFDQKKVTLIVENIVDNALKFTPSGSVQMDWGIKDDSLCIRVKDSGIGIPEDKFEIIFERHTQLQNPVTTQHEGRGLGLFYVKRLIDAIGAKVEITSKIDIGTVFSVCIPLQDIETSSAESEARPTLAPTVAASNDFTNVNALKVLIIDDDEGTCFTLSQMLAQYGIESHSENIPEIGYKRLVSSAPDVVFIDYHMTGLSGDQLALKAQNILSPNATFFVCITAESNKKSLSMLGEIFHEVYLKPFKAERLEDILRNVANSKSVTSSILTSFKNPS